MLNKKTIIISAACLIGGYVIGYGNKPEPEVQIKEVVTIDKQEIEKAVSKERERFEKELQSKNSKKIDITRITKPNGEIIEKIKEREKSSKKEKEKTKKDKKNEKESSKKENVKKETDISVKPNFSKYSLGISVEKPIGKILSTKPAENLDYSVDLGFRLYGPLWLESGYQIKQGGVSLGIRLEF